MGETEWPSHTNPEAAAAAEEFRTQAARVADWVADYRANVERYPVTPDVRPGEIRARLPEFPPEEPESFEAVLADLESIVLPGLTHWYHPGFLAYFSSSASGPGVLAEFVAAALNVNAMLWQTSPAATELEQRVVEWTCRFVGLPADFSGVLLDTASTSSFTALAAARQMAVPGVREQGVAGRADLGPLTLYVSEQAHSSLGRAALAAGFGLNNVRHIPTDDAYAMRPEALESRIKADRDSGCLPVMVCATLGTTSSNAVDPCAQIADVCSRQDVWLHVDAAYAGPAASLPELRELFAGWERADSIVLNPHKWMFTPMDCSVLVYRDAATVRSALALVPEYLTTGVEAHNLMDYGLALGRRFRALKLWFIFRQFGAKGLRQRLRSHVEMARELAGWVENDPRFALAAPVLFSTVCLAAVPPAGMDVNTWNERLLAAVNSRRRFFFSHTTLDGRYVIRVAIGSETVTRETVRQAFEALAAEHDALLRSLERPADDRATPAGRQTPAAEHPNPGEGDAA